jgi:tryptophan-rich sensory protein
VADIVGASLFTGLIIGIYCCVLLVCFAAGHKKAAILIVPHVAYALFGAFMYFKTHHIVFSFISDVLVLDCAG